VLVKEGSGLERTPALRATAILGLELWKRLGLDEFLAQHLDGDGADVAWSRVARGVSDSNRLCAPGSETGRGAELVSIHGTGRSAAYQKRLKINDTPALSLSRPACYPLKDQDRTASESKRYGELFQGGVWDVAAL